MNREPHLTVGEVPNRKGKWLGLEEGGKWRALAKFCSEADAELFLSLSERGMRRERALDDEW